MPRPPDSQQLWQPHPSGDFVQAVAVVPTIEGLPVSLSDTQATLLAQIDNRVNQLLSLFRNPGGDSIFDLVDGAALTIAQSNVLTAEQRNLIAEIKQLLSAPDLVAIGPRLQQIKTAIDSIATLQAQILSRMGTPFRPVNAALGGGVAVINAVTGAGSSSVVSLSAAAKTLLVHPYFSLSTATAAITVELRASAGTALLSRRWVRSANLSAIAVNLSGQFAADTVEIPTQGAVEVVLHVRSVSAGNLTLFLSEVSDV